MSTYTIQLQLQLIQLSTIKERFFCDTDDAFQEVAFNEAELGDWEESFDGALNPVAPTKSEKTLEHKQRSERCYGLIDRQAKRLRRPERSWKNHRKAQYKVK